MQLTFSLDFMDTTSSDLQDLNFLKASEALSDSNGADVSHSRRQEAVNIPDAKQSSDTSGIKHELKNVIKSRRLAKGLDDLQLPTNSADHKPTTEELTEEEEEKRRLRRERNKVAASKCRERKKLKMERLSQEAEDLKEENTALTTDIRGLQQEKDNLISKLRNHHCVLTASSLNSTYDKRQEENEKVLE